MHVPSQISGTRWISLASCHTPFPSQGDQADFSLIELEEALNWWFGLEAKVISGLQHGTSHIPMITHNTTHKKSSKKQIILCLQIFHTICYTVNM